MTSREDLIEEAAKALFDARFAEDRALGVEIPAWEDEPSGIREGWVGQARAALAVFEKAQTQPKPNDDLVLLSDDEREALIREAYRVLSGIYQRPGSSGEVARDILARALNESGEKDD